MLNKKLIEKNEANVKRVTDLAKGSLSATNELMDMKEKCAKYEKEIKLLNGDKAKKKETMKKKLIEVEKLESKLENLNESHLRELKTKDIDFVKARKKWTMSEDKLKHEIQELKEAQQNYQKLEETDSGKIMIQSATEDQKLIQSQKELIGQLKAEKASLQMSLASYNGKENKELVLLKKELENTKRALAQTAYERRLEQKLAEKEPEPRCDEVVSGPESSTDDLAHDDSDASRVNTSSLEVPRNVEAELKDLKEKTSKDYAREGREKIRARSRSRSRSRAVSRERNVRTQRGLIRGRSTKTTGDESREGREKALSNENRGGKVSRPRDESRGRRMNRSRDETREIEGREIKETNTPKDENRETDETGTTVPVDLGTNDSESLGVSTDSSTMPVNNELNKGITAQRSYRNYVRNRKFSKRRTSIQNE